MKSAEEKIDEINFDRDNTKLKKTRPNWNFLGEQAKHQITTRHLTSKVSRQKLCQFRTLIKFALFTFSAI